MLMYALGVFGYLPVIRDHIIQTQYLKAPFNLAGYLKHNPFLPDLNNERIDAIKVRYRQNLLALEALVLVRFESDITGAR
jgi:palmitoyl-protein thioesterase